MDRFTDEYARLQSELEVKSNQEERLLEQIAQLRQVIGKSTAARIELAEESKVLVSAYKILYNRNLHNDTYDLEQDDEDN